MTHTTDPNDPRLGHGSDDAPRPQQDAYCTTCRMHRPVGRDGEFVWVGTDHLTWEPGGELQPSDDCVTAHLLKVGT